MGARIAGPGGGMAGVGVDEAGGGSGDRGHPPASAALNGEGVEVGQGGVALGVHDGVHVLGPAQHPELGHRLVRGDHELHARPLGRHEAPAAFGVPRPAGPEDGVVGGVVDRSRQTERDCAASAPDEWGLTPRGVVLEGSAGEVVAAADDRLAVIGDRLRPHHPHPRHRPAPFSARDTPCNRVQGIGWM